jgi:SulP family sulfate permease
MESVKSEREAVMGALRPMSALRDQFSKGWYGINGLRADLLAGLSVAMIAIPLAMALAIASGVPPQYGLNSAIVGGILAALFGGSRFSISGPTAAFVVLLAPISARYGMAGLATAGLMAGLILVAFALCRLGRLIEYVPESVSLGFTMGIAIVIALLQFNDLLGLGISHVPEHFPQRIQALVSSLPNINLASVSVSGVTLVIALLWPRQRWIIPGYLPAIIAGTLLSLWLAGHGHPIETIGTRFTYHFHGVLGHGVPSIPPQIHLPWNLPGPDGQPFQLSLRTVRELLPAAFTIAILGSIESLLCAVILDRTTRTRHHSNGELLGQGIANLVTPVFGGIPVTAALARSAADVSAGARSPLSGVFHSLFILLAVLVFAPLFSIIPMATMAGLLMVVAWNMSEAPHALRLVRTSTHTDRLVFLICVGLTVTFDMVIAIGVGCVLATMLLMRDLARFTQVRDISTSRHYTQEPLPSGWRMVKITGAMFFAAAERVLRDLLDSTDENSNLILYADGITVFDAGAASAFHRFLQECTSHRNIRVIVTDLQPQVRQVFDEAGLMDGDYLLQVFSSLSEAMMVARWEVTPEPCLI